MSFFIFNKVSGAGPALFVYWLKTVMNFIHGDCHSYICPINNVQCANWRVCYMVEQCPQKPCWSIVLITCADKFYKKVMSLPLRIRKKRILPKVINRILKLLEVRPIRMATMWSATALLPPTAWSLNTYSRDHIIPTEPFTYSIVTRPATFLK